MDEQLIQQALPLQDSNKEPLVNSKTTVMPEKTNSLSNLSKTIITQASFVETDQLSSLDTIYRNNRYYILTLNRVVLAYLYSEHGIIQTAIDQPVEDALRGGVIIKSKELDAVDVDEIQKYITENRILEIVKEAHNWARLFGGAGIIVNTPFDPSTFLQMGDLAPKNQLEFYSADRWELSSPHKDAPFYNFYGINIDSSRVITINGKTSPSYIRRQLQGWGISEIERMVRPLNSFLKNQDVIFALLDEAKIDIYKMAGFNTALLSVNGTANVAKRLTEANRMKSYLNALTMDKDDDYEQKQINFGGLAEMLKENRIGIAAALKMPMTKIFGLSALGFSSGEDDIENYNSMIESEIRSRMKITLKKVLDLIMQKLFEYVPDYKIEFHPLRILNADQEEDVKTKKQNRIMEQYDRGLIDDVGTLDSLQNEGLLATPVESSDF